MASWMVHLRVSDALLSRLGSLSKTEFTVGNIAPDSGVPNDDWSRFTPSSDISHFKEADENGHMRVSTSKFICRYFTKEMQRGYTPKQFSFYLGYLVHLMTDILWVSDVFPKCAEKNPVEYAQNHDAAVWKWKKDFYDLDALYIRKNPDFRSFSIFREAEGFKNEYMDFFSPDAFDLRRKYIVDFYLAKRQDLDREYVYFTERDMDDFVEHAVANIEEQLYSLLPD